MKTTILVLSLLLIALYPRESHAFTAGIGNVGKRQLKMERAFDTVCRVTMEACLGAASKRSNEDYEISRNKN
ncbi:hypothetical protein AC249_AIPGENE4215 [Exaiptasia diaphana]|nr:hypothetical protein AC249_AIPGENE4215 [Exaiptasia diaphana]